NGYLGARIGCSAGRYRDNLCRLGPGRYRDFRPLDAEAHYFTRGILGDALAAPTQGLSFACRCFNYDFLTTRDLRRMGPNPGTFASISSPSTGVSKIRMPLTLVPILTAPEPLTLRLFTMLTESPLFKTLPTASLMTLESVA